jgi:YegS/Rv2252/BmrU family lipid kinase
MNCRTACLIISPRLGKNLARPADMLAVFSAAGWKTDAALNEPGAHTMQLAKHAADAGYDLVIGYGGDGTLNQVVNGVMAAKRRGSIVGYIPGGTANVWAHEIGMPADVGKASLVLVDSEQRTVDLGHVDLDSPPLPPGTTDGQNEGEHHFVLMAGLGFDAAILRRVSTRLKEKIGAAAVVLAAIKVLPGRHAFPIEIRSSGAGGEEGLLWGGEAVQVIVGNTRRYGNIAEITPGAYIDDGLLDVCVITGGGFFSTLGQILSILLHRKPGRGRSKYFQGAHFRIRVPASVDLQLDGSLVKLKDRLVALDRTALVTYRFDAMPRALGVAIPKTYDGALFVSGRLGG